MRINTWLVCALVVGVVLVTAGRGQNPALGQTPPREDHHRSESKATVPTIPTTSVLTRATIAQPPTGVVVPPDAQSPRELVRARALARDRHVEKVRRWRPWSRPTPSQIHRIVAMEADRWNAPEGRLRCRIRGESGFRWYISNGRYQGLGQFGWDAFSRGMRSIGTRRVGFDRTRVVRRWQARRMYYSDGSSVLQERWRRVRVRYTTHYRGAIPADPPITHGYAQVRIMARAMVGLGSVSDSEWEVRC